MKLKMNLKYKATLIDPVPLVNIIVILALFFGVALNFIGSSGIIVDLPHIEQAELYNLNSTVITLSGKNIYISEKEVEINGLKDELMKKNTQLLAIKSDRNVPYSSIAEIISMAQSIGIKQIAMATDENKGR
jgi:biopolymer transport protein ExbD